MNDVQKAAFSIGVIPVIAIDDAEKAVPLARALLAGGLPAAEVTFRTAAGEEAIRRIAAEVPEVLVGAKHRAQPGAVRPRAGRGRQVHRLPRL